MIPYTYQFINVNPDARAMEIVYSSPGHPTQHIGAPMPLVGQTKEQVAEAYAPVNYWQSLQTPVTNVTEGDTGSFVPPVVPEETLDSAKEVRLKEISAWRYDIEVAGIWMNGAQIATDRVSQSQLASAFVSLSSGLVQSVDWKAANGAWVTLNLAAVTAIATAVAAHVQACFTSEKYWAGLVVSATTIDGVKAITPI